MQFPHDVLYSCIVKIINLKLQKCLLLWIIRNYYGYSSTVKLWPKCVWGRGNKTEKEIVNTKIISRTLESQWLVI